MRAIEKKAGLILGGILLFSLVLVVGFVMAATSATTATVTVNTFLSVTLTKAPVQFPSINPNEVSNANVTKGFPLTATIGSESNVDANVGTRADNANFEFGSENFPVSNMEWDNNSSFSAAVDYTTTNVNVCLGVVSGEGCNIFHRLAIPSGQAAGSYSVGVIVSATAV